MINISDNSKIVFHWKISPYDYSKDKLNTIISKASKKYGLSRERIKVIPNFYVTSEDGTEVSINKDIVQNIQDPQFQIKMFEDYIKINGITGYDFELIKKIDNEINGRIDYQVYDKYKRYSIKWIRWDNFLSYGTDNFFDFTTLNGIVLLSGKPQNQSGKSTFAIDLLHFLLFGKTDKADVQSKIFNKHLPEATNVTVEGCINIDGDDYIIKRILSRPSFNKRSEKSKVTQKVEYYRIVGGEKEELEEYIDNQQEENSVQTNKVIKEAIGIESDFDLVMSITESNLDALISMKDTERGRILSRWIGLLPIEAKDTIAREKFNSEIKPALLSNKFNSESLKQEITAFEFKNKSRREMMLKINDSNKAIDGEIKLLEDNRNILLQSRMQIDNNVLNLDISTLNMKIENIINEGKKKKFEYDKIQNRIKEIGDVDFSVEEYDKTVQELSSLKERRGSLLSEHKSINAMIENLINSEYCPVCKRKLDNVNNEKPINENKQRLSDVIKEGKKVGEMIKSLESKIESMKANRELYTEKSKLSMSSAAMEVSLARLRENLKENKNLMAEYEKNSEAINKNNDIDIQIRNNDIRLQEKRKQKEINIREFTNCENEITYNLSNIEERKEIIEKIAKEEVLVRNWKIYLEMVGKNGISKMVFRKTLPIINAKLAQLLSDVCDFDVEVGINAKNDVMFYLIKDGVKSDLSSGSGFEKTAASLALRTVLSELSTIPKNSFILADEITARVSEENLDNIRNLITKMCKNYSFIFLVSHNPTIKTWANTNVVVEKVDNISKITIEK